MALKRGKNNSELNLGIIADLVQPFAGPSCIEGERGRENPWYPTYLIFGQMMPVE